MYHYRKYKEKKKINITKPTLSNPDYVVYSDGACWNEKYDTSIGRGGYGTIIIASNSEDYRGIEFSEGYIETTNNRMELMAVIVPLENIPPKSRVRIYSDSQYVVKIIRGINQINANHDLWTNFHGLQLTKELQIDAVWIKGHDGNKNNERCDRIAKAACKKKDLQHDIGYEMQTQSFGLRSELDIPEKYKEKNTHESTVQNLIDKNHVNPECATAIIEFWKSNDPLEEEYSKLKTFGMDYWSSFRYEWFTENCDNEVLEIVANEFSEIGDQVKCLKWYMRGLSLYEAIRKTAYDIECFRFK